MQLLMTGAFQHTEEQLNKIKALGYNVQLVSDETLPLEMDVANIEAIICNGLFLYNDIARFAKLKFIQLTSSGIDRVPLDYIYSHDIELNVAKRVYGPPMAEWAVLKILEICKNSRHFYEAQIKRSWEKRRDLIELSGKTAVIVGFGDMGTQIAKRLRAFNVKIAAVDVRFVEPLNYELVDEYYEPSELEKVLGQSEIIILAVPLNDKTRHMINAHRIGSMPDGCILINAARGAVIDESALVDALRSNKFLGVALDVFSQEPLPAFHPLWSFQRVIITPHNAFVSDKINERLFQLILMNLSRFMFKSRSESDSYLESN